LQLASHSRVVRPHDLRAIHLRSPAHTTHVPDARLSQPHLLARSTTILDLQPAPPAALDSTADFAHSCECPSGSSVRSVRFGDICRSPVTDTSSRVSIERKGCSLDGWDSRMTLEMRQAVMMARTSKSASVWNSLSSMPKARLITPLPRMSPLREGACSASICALHASATEPPLVVFRPPATRGSGDGREASSFGRSRARLGLPNSLQQFVGPAA